MTSVTEATIFGNGIGEASMLEIGNILAAPDVAAADDPRGDSGPAVVAVHSVHSAHGVAA